MGRETWDEVCSTQVYAYPLHQATCARQQYSHKFRACHGQPNNIGENPWSSPGLQAQLQSTSQGHRDKNGHTTKHPAPNNGIYLKSHTFDGQATVFSYYTSIAHLWGKRVASSRPPAKRHGKRPTEATKCQSENRAQCVQALQHLSTTRNHTFYLYISG